ncbi:MAG: helix-turn-helix domain-containing protein [Phycisphaerae bacterium]
MILWHLRYLTYQPLASLPQLTNISAERRTETAYRHLGRYRRSEPQCVFQYTLTGRGVFRDAGGEHDVPAGTGFLVKINDPATAYYYPADAEQPWEFMYVAFVGRSADGPTAELTARFGPLYSLPMDSGIIARLLELGRRGSEQLAVSPGQGARLVTDLLTSLADSRQPAAPDDPSRRLATDAIQLVQRNVEHALNATELAELLGVSREHLTRVFAEQTGQTPYRYIQRRKALRAAHLLKESSLTNKQIAARLGYSRPGHFTRAFKSVMGLTPSRFRAVGSIPTSF